MPANPEHSLPCHRHARWQQRALLAHALQREHALLQQSSAPEAANTLDLPRPWHGTTLTARGRSGTSADAIVLQRVRAVEDMFRKARLRRCFQHMTKKQQGGDNHLQSRGLPEVSSPSGNNLLVRRPSHIEAEGVSALDEEASKYLHVEREIPSERARPPQPEVIHPSHPDDALEPIPPEGPMASEEQPFANRHPPASRDESEEAAERAERRNLLRRFFHAARRDERLDLGGFGNSLGRRGAPCFTVGGSGMRPSRGPARRENQGYDGDFVGPGGVGLRRAELLRRILHAMRYAPWCRVALSKSLELGASQYGCSGGSRWDLFSCAPETPMHFRKETNNLQRHHKNREYLPLGRSVHWTHCDCDCLAWGAARRTHVFGWF